MPFITQRCRDIIVAPQLCLDLLANDLDASAHYDDNGLPLGRFLLGICAN